MEPRALQDMFVTVLLFRSKIQASNEKFRNASNEKVSDALTIARMQQEREDTIASHGYAAAWRTGSRAGS